MAESSLSNSQESYFPPNLSAPAQARELVEDFLTCRGWQHLAEDVCLVVSELVGNAVVHARTPVRVRVAETPFSIRLTVHDESADLPTVSLASRVRSDSESGRGLWLVDACSTDWGTELAGDGGKCMWAVFAIRCTAS